MKLDYDTETGAKPTHESTKLLGCTTDSGISLPLCSETFLMLAWKIISVHRGNREIQNESHPDVATLQSATTQPDYKSLCYPLNCFLSSYRTREHNKVNDSMKHDNNTNPTSYNLFLSTKVFLLVVCFACLSYIVDEDGQVLRTTTFWLSSSSTIYA